RDDPSIGEALRSDLSAASAEDPLELDFAAAEAKLLLATGAAPPAPSVAAPATPALVGAKKLAIWLVVGALGGAAGTIAWRSRSARVPGPVQRPSVAPVA